MSAFYSQLDDAVYASHPATAGPWSAEAQHAGPPSALLARAIERHEPREGMRLADFRADILGPIPVAPLEVSARTLRGGRSMELIEATASAGGRPVLAARGWRILRASADFPPLPADGAAAVAGSGPRRTALELPPASATLEGSLIPGAHEDGYLAAVEWRFTTGGPGSGGVAEVWGRQLIDLVEGEESDAFQRALVLADSAGGVTFTLDPRRHRYINCDISVSLHRDPEGEWLRMSAESIASPGHGGLVRNVLADGRGEVGIGVQTMVAQEL